MTVATWTWAADTISHFASRLKNTWKTVSLRYTGGRTCDYLQPPSGRRVSAVLFCLSLTLLTSPLFSLTPLFIHFLKNTLPVLQWGAHDGSSGEEVCQVWHRPGQVGGLQPDVVPVRQLHVLPLQRAHHWLQPLLPARTLTWCSLPPLPQMLPLDRPHGNLSVILTSHFFFLLAWLWTDVTLPLRPVYILS